MSRKSALLFVSLFFAVIVSSSVFAATKSLEIKGLVTQDGVAVSSGYKVGVKNLNRPENATTTATGADGKYAQAFVNIFVPVADVGDVIQVEVKTPSDASFKTVSAAYADGTLMTIDVSAVTVATPPAPPSGLTLTINTSGAVLGWTDGSFNETGFRIEKQAGSSSFTVVTTVGAGIMTYSDLFSPIADVSYSYRVSATNSVGASSPVSGSVTLPSTPTAPSAPTSFQAVATETSVSLSWTNTATNATENRVSRKVSDNPFVDIATLPAASTGYVDNTVTSGTTYNYRLVAKNGVGESSSVEVLAITPVGLPTAPVDIVATATSETSVSLSWTNTATNATEIRVDQAKGAEDFTTVGNLAQTATSFVVSGLSAGTTYKFRIGASNSKGVFWSSTTSVTTPLILPGDPTGLAAIASGTSISLSWVDNSANETGFEVQERVGQFGVFVTVTTVAANATTLTRTGLTVGEQYVYHVRAIRVGGVSNWSAEASATIATPPPAIPTGIAANAASQTQVNVVWNDVSSETGYRVEMAAPSAGFTLAGAVGENVVAFSATGLTANTVYRFRVIAWNAGGSASPSAEVSATTLTTPTPLVGTPTGLATSSVGQNSLTLTWNSVVNATGYKIGWRYGSQAFSELISLGAVTTYQVNELTANTSYVFQVMAVNGTALSNWSGEVSATTLPVPATLVPSAPSGLVNTAVSQTSVSLAWLDNSANETGFEIWRHPVTGGTIPFVLIATVGSGVNSYVSTGLTAGTSYVYVIRAVNASGNSALSAEITVKTTSSEVVTPPTPPSAPINFMVTGVSSSRISLSWQYPSSAIDGFRLTGFFGAMDIDPTKRSIELGGLSSGTTYSFTLVAFNGTSLSPAATIVARTTEVTTTTPPTPATPTSLAVSDKKEKSLTLTWSHDLANTNSFEIQRNLVTVGTPTSGSFVDTGLSPDTEYAYRVRAVGNGGSGDWSATINGKTLPLTTVVTKPNPPKSLKAEKAPLRGVILTWNYSGTEPDNFSLRKKNADGGEVAVALIPSGMRSYNDESAITTPGTSIVYLLYAVLKSGEVSESVGTTITFPEVPLVTETKTITVTGVIAYANGSPVSESDAKDFAVLALLNSRTSSEKLVGNKFSVTLASETTLLKVGESLTLKILDGNFKEVAAKTVSPSAAEITLGKIDVGTITTTLLQSTLRLIVSGEIDGSSSDSTVRITNVNQPKIAQVAILSDTGLYEATLVSLNPVASTNDLIKVEVFAKTGKSLGTKTINLTVEQVVSGKLNVSFKVFVDWDVSGDGIIDITDLVRIGLAFGQTGFTDRADVNNDGVVDIVDLVIVARHFGEKISETASAPARIREEDAPLLSRWLEEARVANDGSEVFRQGIANLERLLVFVAPQRTALFQNFPNPFNPETWIPFQLKESSNVRIQIFSASGELIRTLSLGFIPEGDYLTHEKAAYWDGMNDIGERVASGTYLYRLQAGRYSASRRLVILK